MPSMSVLSEWKKYTRYSDHRRVGARLVKKEGTTFMEIREARIGPFSCPHCGELLTQIDTGAFPNFYLEPKVFHEKHKPV